MTLIPRNNLFNFDRFFNDSWPQLVESGSSTFFAPRVDIKEQGNHYEITAELPGVDKKDIQVHVKDGILTLEAELEQEDKGGWICRSRCWLDNPKLAETVRKLIRKFDGDAVSRRIYNNFTMVYYYAEGKVEKIMEISDQHLKIIYENRRKQLQQLFARQDVEKQIELVYRTIDMLLDRRLRTKKAEDRRDIDKRLKQAVDQLFYLEA